MKTIGLIGAGSMGEPMGAALLRAGFGLRVCAHRRREAIERLVAQGAREVSDPAAVARDSDALITMVPDAPQVEEVLFGEHGAVHGLGPGKYVIDMSTISPIASRTIHQRLSGTGVKMLDAPVSGGPARAAKGELTIMVGGDPETFAACEPIFRALGTATLLGPPGMGETVKLVNQVIIASTMIANIEGLVFAKKAGADIDSVLKVLASATASNYILEKWLPQSWLAGQHTGGFALDLLRKDLAAALDAGGKMSVAMPLTGLAYQLYTAASAKHGRDDYSAVAKIFEGAAGVNVAAR